MKFTCALCLFVVVGAALGAPIDSEVPTKVKEPVPLIVSDYSSVVKDDASVVAAAAVVPEVKSGEPEATDAPVTEAEEASLLKEFNEEVKQEEKLLSPEASSVDEVRSAEDVEVTTVADVKESEPVVEAKSVVQEDEVPTEEPVAQEEESTGRVVREADAEVESTTPAEGRSADDVEFTTVSS